MAWRFFCLVFCKRKNELYNEKKGLKEKAKINFTPYLSTYRIMVRVNVLNFHTPKKYDKMAYANIADPDQTFLKEHSDQGLYCFPFHYVF